MTTRGSSTSSGQTQEDEGGGIPPLLRCTSCNEYSQLRCDNCSQCASSPKIVVGKVENLSIIPHQVTVGHFTDYSCGAQDDVSCMLGSSTNGDVYINKMKAMPITLRHTIINLGPGQVKVNMATDLDQMREASDGVFMLKSDWSTPTECHHPGGTEVLVTQMINKCTDNFFLDIMTRIHKEDLPENVISELYNKFNLRLIGLTKSLQVLMKVEAEQVENMMGREQEIRKVLEQFVPEERLPHVTWSDFFHIPVQCSDDMQTPGDQAEGLTPGEEVASKQTVTGALTYACRYGNYLTCQRLLKQPNADVREWNQEGQSPFHVACRYGQSHLLPILLEAGADIHEPDKTGLFPLHLACGPFLEEEHKKLSTVRWLLDHGAGVSQKSRDGLTALDLAKKEDYHRDAVKLLQNYSS